MLMWLASFTRWDSPESSHCSTQREAESISQQPSITSWRHRCNTWWACALKGLLPGCLSGKYFYWMRFFFKSQFTEGGFHGHRTFMNEQTLCWKLMTWVIPWWCGLLARILSTKTQKRREPKKVTRVQTACKQICIDWCLVLELYNLTTYTTSVPQRPQMSPKGKWSGHVTLPRC